MKCNRYKLIHTHFLSWVQHEHLEWLDVCAVWRLTETA